MQVSMLLKLLSNVSKFVGSLGHPAIAQELRSLQELFAGQEGVTVARCIGALAKKKPKYEGNESEAIRSMRATLMQLETLLLSAQGKGAAADIGLLNGLLANCPHSDLAQFVAEARNWATKPSGRVPDSTGLRSDVIARYMSELQQAKGRNDVFDQVIQKLRFDKRARGAEMHEIASKFIGFESKKKKTRELALQAIADHQALDARQAARAPKQA
jgi:hypothetical protein